MPKQNHSHDVWSQDMKELPPAFFPFLFGCLASEGRASSRALPLVLPLPEVPLTPRLDIKAVPGACEALEEGSHSMKISPSWFLQDSKSYCMCRNIKPSLCFHFLLVMRLQLSKMEFSDMKITWQKVSGVQICMGFSDPSVSAMPCRGAGICPEATNPPRATGRAEKLRQMLPKLYGTYLREAKQRTNAFLLECIKVAPCTAHPSAFPAMHGWDCMQQTFLQVWQSESTLPKVWDLTAP